MIDAVLNAAPAWALSHAAPLLIMVPLFLAPLLALVPTGRIAWIISIAATGISFLFALILLGLVQTSPIGVVSYEVGRWPVPLGIELRVDALQEKIEESRPIVVTISRIIAFSASTRSSMPSGTGHRPTS